MTRPSAGPTTHRQAPFDHRRISIGALCTALGLASVEVGHASSRNGYDLASEVYGPVNGRTRYNRRLTSVVVLCTATGLASVAVADAASRHGYGYGEASPFLWLGLLLIFVPIAVRVLQQDTDRRERLALVILLGTALYAVKILSSPYTFTFFDEYIWLRNTEDILRTQHLFSYNPLLAPAAYYPGLASVTAGLVDLTGLSPFVSGLLIIGLARFLLSGCFFLVAESVTGSGRAAAGASLVYAANPMFLFWSSSFSYEDLALPLGVFVIWWLGLTRRETNLPAPAITVVAIEAVVITHHIVGFALAALLGAWWLIERLTNRPPAERRYIGLLALVASTTALAWFLFVARPAVTYLFTDNIVPALHQTVSLVVGHTAPRRFYTSGGHASPEWQTVAGFAAVGVLLLALPIALCLAWRRRDRPSMVIAMVVAAAFPLSLLPRLVPEGVAISGRSSEYVFLGLGCVLGLLANNAARPRPGRHLRWITGSALVRASRTAVVTAVVTLVFIGEITVGTPFYELLPESSHPQGYPWSMQPDVVSAANWTREHLGINQRFGADATDALALAAYGEQDPVAEDSIWPIFFAKVMSGVGVRDIRATRVRYIFVNWQMTRGVPPTPGYYFSSQEPGAGNYSQPFPAAALQKFTSDSCAHLVYHSGLIQIFDVSRIENGSCPLAFPSTTPIGVRR